MCNLKLLSEHVKPFQFQFRMLTTLLSAKADTRIKIETNMEDNYHADRSDVQMHTLAYVSNLCTMASYVLQSSISGRYTLFSNKLSLHAGQCLTRET